MKTFCCVDIGLALCCFVYKQMTSGVEEADFKWLGQSIALKHEMVRPYGLTSMTMSSTLGA